LPAGFKLSVVIPVYNEVNWLRELLRRVRAVPIPKEMILVDDCSTDGTREILEEIQDDDDRRSQACGDAGECQLVDLDFHLQPAAA
jgi:glycosyltransferase involved in cell wall biosynthesis